MKNSLETVMNKPIVVSGVAIVAIMVLGTMAMNILCQRYGYGSIYKGMFEDYGNKPSKNLIELNTPGCGTIYIVNGVWVDRAARFGGF